MSWLKVCSSSDPAFRCKQKNRTHMDIRIYLQGENDYTWKESTIAVKVFWDDGHCLSLALATNKITVFPFAVAFAIL